MPITRALSNGSTVVDWTDDVPDIANQYGLFKNMGLFAEKGLGTRTALFDINTSNNSMIPASNPVAQDGFKGKERSLNTYSLSIPYFKHIDYITPDDIQGWRKGGTPDQAEDLPNVRAEKFEDMKFNMDQSVEYMMVNAIKGTTVDPEGNTLAAMHTILGTTQKTIDFALGTSATNIDAKIAELKRYVAKNAKTGGAIGKIEVPCSPEFFDALTQHPNMIAAYNYYQNSGKQLNRDDLSIYEKWGVVDIFEHKGIKFFSYDAVFTQPDGTSKRAFGTDSTAITKQEGYSIVRGMRNMYRVFYGPDYSLNGANRPGSEMYLKEYRDPKDKFIELEAEMAPLPIITKPLVSVRCYTTT
jgi:hypothetical protein